MVFDLGVEEVGLGDQGEVAHAKAVGPHAHRTDHGLIKKKFDNKKRERERKRIVKERERERSRISRMFCRLKSSSNTANTTILFHSLNVVFPSFCLCLVQISKLFFTLRRENVSFTSFTSFTSSR